ncbi:hypothetical protein A2317_02005 [Candidatus Uhrbacteria bacterium RIFOXYB2_FULL_41_10]|nr:MAG: hypothetical protein A2317_02005 [Candidatus Uhrbacteria bacterium RIFOXYB2_FULL_41_10]
MEIDGSIVSYTSAEVTQMGIGQSDGACWTDPTACEGLVTWDSDADGDGLDQTYAITAWNLDSTPFVVLTDGTVLWLDLRVTQVDGDAFIDEDEAGTGYILYMMDVCP